MRRALADCGAQVEQGVLDALLGQAVHQVEVEIVEAGSAGHVGGANGLVAIVDAPQRLEFGFLEALHADGQTVDAEASVGAELGLLEGAGVGFQGDFDITGKADASFHAFENPPQCTG